MASRVGWLGRMATVLVVLAAAVITCCSAGAEGAEDSNDKRSEQGIRIGFSMDSFVVERWHRDRDGFLRAAGNYGAQVLLRSANEDVEVQRQQLIELSHQNIDVLVVIPNDSEKLSDVIEQIRSRGIPVLAYDRLIRNTPIDGYVSFDNQGIGTLMAEAVVAAVQDKVDGTGSILVLNGALPDYNSFMINRGIVTYLRPHIERGSIRLLDSLWLQSWRNEEARDAIESAYSRFDYIDGVIAANDLIAEAVVHSAAVRGHAGRLVVSGMDGDLAAVQRVAEGTQLMTVYKPVELLAARALEAAIELVDGPLIHYSEIIFNGSNDVPYIQLEPVVVTQESIMATVVADGFHCYEDVYRNIPQKNRPAQN